MTSYQSCSEILINQVILWIYSMLWKKAEIQRLDPTALILPLAYMQRPRRNLISEHKQDIEPASEVECAVYRLLFTFSTSSNSMWWGLIWCQQEILTLMELNLVSKANTQLLICLVTREIKTELMASPYNEVKFNIKIIVRLRHPHPLRPTLVSITKKSRIWN